MSDGPDPRKALRWIVGILQALDIPFLIVGGLAARAHGSRRKLADIDLYVPGERLDSILEATSGFIVSEPEHVVTEHWDVTFMALEHAGQRIEIGDGGSAKIRDKLTGAWVDAGIDHAHREMKTILDLDVPVMPRNILIAYKRLLGRDVDEEDISQMGEPSLIALTRLPSSSLDRCQLTHLPRTTVDPEKARAQHAAYRKLLAECGARVITLAADEEHPDAVFVEDTAIVLDEVAVMMSMGSPERRAERPAVEAELARHRPIERIDSPARIDGGDVLRIGRTLYVGRSSRTDQAGIEALRGIASKHDYRVVPVGIRDCLHLKSGCTALDEMTVLINPAWIDPGAFAGLGMVPVPESEPRGACALAAGRTLCPSAACPETERMLGERGLRLATTDISEFHKMEGGMTCLSVLLESRT